MLCWVNEYVWQQFLDKKWLKNSVRNQFLPKVAETLGRNLFLPGWFKPVLAETCQPCLVGLKPILKNTTSFSALTLLVGSFDPQKPSPK